jgi:hypothetical protein
MGSSNSPINVYSIILLFVYKIRVSGVLSVRQGYAWVYPKHGKNYQDEIGMFPRDRYYPDKYPDMSSNGYKVLQFKLFGLKNTVNPISFP